MPIHPCQGPFLLMRNRLRPWFVSPPSVGFRGYLLSTGLCAIPVRVASWELADQMPADSTYPAGAVCVLQLGRASDALR
jgi:hypothetical protein